KANTRVLLDYQASTDKEKKFLIEIAFRIEGSQGEFRVIQSREVRVQTSESRLFDFFFRLPPNAYQVDVDILDLDLDERQYLRLPQAYRLLDVQPVRLSDVYLSYQRDPEQAFAEPILTQSVDPERGKIYYSLNIEAPAYEVLTFRAELYEKKPDTEREAVSFLVSIDQIKRVFYLENGRGTFQDSLDIADLPSGQYQIDIRIYDDNQRLAARKGSFSLGSDLKKWIFSNLDEAFRMMIYVYPNAQLDSLLEQERDPFVRREAFSQIWEDMYEDKAEEEMERYYRKVFAANERYAEADRQGWESDRGRIFILYGEPREKSIEIAGKSHLRWTYPRWSLSFLFEKRNQSYELIE
ncbi:MAG: GWxTD domain-containing protein, partial [Bacteroidota bacterium]